MPKKTVNSNECFDEDTIMSNEDLLPKKKTSFVLDVI